MKHLIIYPNTYCADYSVIIIQLQSDEYLCSGFLRQMGLLIVPAVLLVISAVHAFQYAELAQYVDSHQEEYVEVYGTFFFLPPQDHAILNTEKEVTD